MPCHLNINYYCYLIRKFIKSDNKTVKYMHFTVLPMGWVDGSGIVLYQTIIIKIK